MKVAVIGNSHVVALQNAVKEYSREFKHLSFTFYAAPARDAHSISVVDNKLIAKSEKTKKFYLHTSGGNQFVDLEKYDVIWLYGLTEQLDKVAAWYQNVYKSDAFSSSVKSASYVDRYNIGFKLLPRLSKKTVIISPRPLPSDTSVYSTECDSRYDVMQETVAYMKDMAMKHGAHYLLQPVATFQSPSIAITNPIFSEGSQSLSLKSQTDNINESDRQDFLHMNQRFGKHMLEVFSDKLKELL